MSDEIPRALTEMWREVPVGTAPLAKIERDLKARSETHKRRLMVAGAVAGVAVVAVAAAVFQVGGGSGSRTEAAGPAPAVDGMRYFGMNDVVAAVPDTWAQQEPVCSTPTNPYVYFRSSAIYNCPREKPTAHSLPVANLEIGSLSASDITIGALPYQTTRDGLEILSDGVSCTDEICEEKFAVPSSDVLFIARIPSDVADKVISDIGYSIVRLPEGYTTVPFIDPGTALNTAEDSIREAGLTVANPGAGSGERLVLDISPDPGSVSRIGSTITFDVTPD